MAKIPKEVIDGLNINFIEEKEKEFEVTAIVERHQVKLPIPKKLFKLFDLEFQKGQRLKLEYDEKKKELRYKL